MVDQSRLFTAGPDPFGRTWNVKFRWLQTGISIRHADTVDVKFGIGTAGEPFEERVIALSHPVLLALSEKYGHPLTVFPLAASRASLSCPSDPAVTKGVASVVTSVGDAWMPMSSRVSVEGLFTTLLHSSWPFEGLQPKLPV